jgi:hypothetical protein
VSGVRVGLCNVFTVYKQALEVSINGVIEHVWNTQTWLGLDSRAPQLFKHGAGCIVAYVAVARKFVWE